MLDSRDTEMNTANPVTTYSIVREIKNKQMMYINNNYNLHKGHIKYECNVKDYFRNRVQ